MLVQLNWSFWLFGLWVVGTVCMFLRCGAMGVAVGIPVVLRLCVREIGMTSRGIVDSVFRVWFWNVDDDARSLP